MDPFFNAVGGAIAVIFIFFISVVAGSLVGAAASREPAARNALSVLASLGIFLFLFFLRKRFVAH